MSILPQQKRKIERVNPKRMMVIGRQKIGKTAAMEWLGDEDKEKALILDFEDGSAYIKGYKMDIIGLKPPFSGETAETKKLRGEQGKYYLSEVIADIVNTKKETGEFPFKYVIVDTLTKMEKYCEAHATEMFMFQSLQGKTFNREADKKTLKPESQWESVITIGIGGYTWLRLSFATWLNLLDKVAPHVILIGHTKDKNVDMEAKQVTVDDIDLTGRIRGITASSCDAIATMYRKKNQTILSFAHRDLEAGARCPHLSGKDIVVLESDKNGENLKGDWSKIYIDEEAALIEANKK